MKPETLAALHRKVFDVPRPWRSSEFEDILSRDNTRLFHRENGFAIGQFAGPEAELLTIAVDPSTQRKGIGRSLLREFLSYAQREAVSEVILEVSEQNEAAQALYLAEGFTQVGQRKDYYETPRGKRISAIVMKITLNQSSQ